MPICFCYMSFLNSKARSYRVLSEDIKQYVKRLAFSITLTKMHIKTIYKTPSCVIFKSYWKVRDSSNIICCIRVCVYYVSCTAVTQSVRLSSLRWQEFKDKTAGALQERPHHRKRVYEEQHAFSFILL